MLGVGDVSHEAGRARGEGINQHATLGTDFGTTSSEGLWISGLVIQ